MKPAERAPFCQRIKLSRPRTQPYAFVCACVCVYVCVCVCVCARARVRARGHVRRVCGHVLSLIHI